MTTVIVKIWDSEEGLQMEATLDNADAINEPPTPALIVGSYLGANSEAFVQSAMRWFQDQVTAPPEVYMPKDKEIKT